MITSKQWSAITPVWFSAKLQVTWFIDLTTYEPIKRTFKMHLDNTIDNIFWKLSDCNGTRTQNYLARKQSLNHLAELSSLAKWLSVCLRSKWLWVRVLLQSLNLQIPCLFRAMSSLALRQPQECRLTLNAYVRW